MTVLLEANGAKELVEEKAEVEGLANVKPIFGETAAVVDGAPNVKPNPVVTGVVEVLIDGVLKLNPVVVVVVVVEGNPNPALGDDDDDDGTPNVNPDGPIAPLDAAVDVVVVDACGARLSQATHCIDDQAFTTIHCSHFQLSPDMVVVADGFTDHTVLPQFDITFLSSFVSAAAAATATAEVVVLLSLATANVSFSSSSPSSLYSSSLSSG